MNVQHRASYNVAYKTKENEYSYLTFYSEQHRDNYLESNVVNVVKTWVDLYYYVSGTLFKFSNVTEQYVSDVKKNVEKLVTESEVATYLQKLELNGVHTNT